ncbi:MAG: hypothetical protein M3Y27_10005 [Acidobacteriota bacterium]|nr:hypothetical protein [Acidobacteriota bacterium]
MERLQKAGWLKPRIKPRDNNDELPLTEKGKRRQLELLRAFRELEAADLDRLFAHDLAHVYAILRAYAPPEFHVDMFEERPPGPLAGKN